MVSSIKAALISLGQFGVRSETIDFDLQEFLYNYQIYSHKAGQGKQHRQKLIDYQITASSLEEELLKEWNAILPVKLKRPASKRRPDDSAGGPSSSLNVPTGSTETDLMKTPVVKTAKRMKFQRLTPKTEVLSTFDCTVCSRSYNWLKALKKHVKSKHPNETVSVDLKEITDMVTCRMCSVRQQRNLIMRHLKTVHNVMKDDDGKIFRGFQSYDDGGTWHPLFLKKGEDNPPPEWVLEVFPADGKNNSVEVVDKADESDEKIGSVEAVDKDEESGEYAEVRNVDEENGKVDVSSNPTSDRVESPLIDCETALMDLEDEFVREKEMQGCEVVQTVLDSSPVLNQSLDLDSDCEMEDSSEFTESRLEMKSSRYKRRNQVEKSPKLSELEGNKTIIKDFVDFIQKEKLTITNPRKLSTINKECGHLFYYDDSMLEYLSKEVENYSLDRHFHISSLNLLEVKDPKDWIDSSGGPSGKQKPSRRKEQLKAHAKWREFVKDKLEEQTEDSSLETLMKREILIKKIDKIGNKISDRQTFSQLSQLETHERLERQKAKETLNPSHSYNEVNCVQVWFTSKEAIKEEEECMKIWEKTVAGKKIGSREFTRFSNWCRFTVALEDKNRRSVYNFSNKDFRTKCKKWLPEPGHEVDQIQLLPDGWNPDIPPEEITEPSCWVIKLTGSQAGLKGGRAADLILTRKSHELCLKYRDLKQTLWTEDDLKDEECFFVNFKGSALGPMQRSKGSLFHKFSSVTGVTNSTQNTIRRGVESKIQSNPDLKSQVENLQSHSRAVGLTYYDKSGTNVRASFIDQLASKESPMKTRAKVPEEVQKKRAEIDMKDQEKNLEAAKKLLVSDRMRKNTRLSKKCKILPHDREFLQILFSNPEAGEIFHALKASFPGNCLLMIKTILLTVLKYTGDQSWRRDFYRCVDSLATSDGDRLREVEERSFSNLVKEEVETELGVWSGLEEQNRLADFKIASSIKTAFKNYERNKKSYEKSFFKF